MFRSVDEYIASQPSAVQPALQRMRHAIRKALPKADEVIAYNMPAYKSGDVTLVHFAGWKHHVALYCASKSLLAEFKEDLRPYKIDRGTIRFPLTEPLPEKLIGKIAAFRAKHRS